MSVVASDKASRHAKAQGQLVDHVQKTATVIKGLDLLVRMFACVVALLAFWLVACIVDHWIVPLPSVIRWVIWLVGSAALLAVLWRQIIPLVIGKINPEYAALRIEHVEPEFKNGLISWLQLQEAPGAVPKGVMAGLTSRAMRFIGGQEPSATVDTSPLIMLLGAFLLLSASMGAYAAASPKSVLDTAQRMLMPWAGTAAPTRVKINSVQPGNANLGFGKPLLIQAEVRGTRDGEPVEVVFSSTDRQIENDILILQPTNVSYAFVGELKTAAHGVEHELEYYVRAGDAESSRFHITLNPMPSVNVELLELEFPAYTRLEKQTVVPGSVEAVEGTQVRVQARSNEPMKYGTIEVNPKIGESGRLESVERRIAMKVADRKLTGDWQLQLDKKGSSPTTVGYQVRVRNENDDVNLTPILHQISVLADLPPEVEILGPPSRRLRVRSNAKLNIDIRALDPDFGLTAVRLSVLKNGQKVTHVDVISGSNLTGKQSKRQPLNVQALRVEPGDVIELQATALDNRHDARGKLAPNAAEAEPLLLDIVDQDQPNDEKQLDGKNGNSQDPTGDTDQNPNQPDPARAQDGSQNQGSPNPGGNQEGAENSEQNGTSGAANAGDQGQANSGKDSSDGPQGRDQDSGQGGGAGASGDQASGGEASQSGGASASDGSAKENSDPSGSQNGGAGNSAGESGEGANAGGQQSGGDNRSGGNSTSNSEGQASDGSAGGNESRSANGGEEQGNDTGGRSQSDAAGNPSAGGQEASGQNSSNQADGKSPTDPDAMRRLRELMEQSQGDGGRSQQNGSGQSATGDSSNSNNAAANDDSRSGDPNSPGDQQSDASQSAAGDGSEADSNTGESEGVGAGGGSGEQAGGEQAGGEQAGGEQAGGEQAGEASNEQPGTETGSGDVVESQANGNEGDSNGSGEGPKDASGEEAGTGESASENAGSGGGKGQGSEQAAKGGEQAAQGSEQSAQGGEQSAQGGEQSGEGGGKQPSGAPGSESSGSESSGSESSGSESSGSESSGSEEQGESSGSKSGESPSGNSPSGNSAEGAASEAAAGESGQKSGKGANGEPGKQGESGGQGESSRSKGSPGSEADGSQAPEGQAGQAGESGKPNQQPQQSTGKSERSEGQPGASESQPSKASQGTGSPSSQAQQSQAAQPGGAKSGPPSSGGQAGGSTGQAAAAGDAANEEFTEETTNMVLDYLNRQREQPDPELLDRLQWTENDMRRFLDRWNKARDLAQTGSEEDRAKWQDMLGSLNRKRTQVGSLEPTTANDDYRQISGSSGRHRPPESLRRQWEAFYKATREE